MSKKTAIVTGGAKGIGESIARVLLEKGVRVVVADKDVRSPWKKGDERLLFIKTDVSNEPDVIKMIKETIKVFGSIDYLINNAGTLFNDKRPKFEDITLKEWNLFIGSHLTGAFLCSKYSAPYIKSNKGSIVNIASTRYLQSEPNTEPYSAAKGGLVAITHAMAISLGPDVRVNCVSPGWIHTQNEKLRKIDHLQHPVGRVGEPEDIASMVAFLLSDQARFITGQNFVVDGGMTKKMIYQE